MFVDPRSDPVPTDAAVSTRLTENPDDLSDLHVLCHEGRIYDVERWISRGQPLQLAAGVPRRGRQRRTSALEIALERADHGLTLLLLCNGYDPNLEQGSPLDLALQGRRWDLLDLLLDWGADPHDVCLEDLFGTYDSALFQRFMDFGVDLTAYHDLASALGYHTSNKPLFGFVRRHRSTNPKFQTELNMALGHHAAHGNEKGASLCLWAGADPHAPAPSLRYSFGGDNEGDEDEDEEDDFRGFSAIHEACSTGRAELLEKLGPDPKVDDFEDLFRWAHTASVIELLARYALPQNVGSVISTYLGWWPWRDDWESLYKLRALFRAGARWDSGSKEEVGNVRRTILKLSDHTFEKVMELLAEGDHCSPEIRTELARTPSIRKRMKEVGFFPPDNVDPYQYRGYGPTKSRRFLSTYGIELPKPPPPPLPRWVQIGARRVGGKKLEIVREELFDYVWAKPMLRLASEWGMSDRGLAKACRRLKIPVPPRGYWAKKAAGQNMRRPKLPKLKEGEAEKIVIWMA